MKRGWMFHVFYEDDPTYRVIYRFYNTMEIIRCDFLCKRNWVNENTVIRLRR